MRRLGQILLLGLTMGALHPLEGKSGEVAEGNKTDATVQFEEISREWDHFKSQYGQYRIRLFEEKGPKSTRLMRPSDRKARAEYLSLKESLHYWSRVSQLKKDLVDRYLTLYPDIAEGERESVSWEANQLAKLLISEIDRLQKEYGIHTFPAVHNLLIDIKLKRRGACKHWAEDLLTLINQQAHPHFVSYWGEAHPGNILEHNVAVLVPRGAPFKDGILIDPWRMAGEPFWVGVKEDKHPWQIWEEYEPQ